MRVSIDGVRLFVEVVGQQLVLSDDGAVQDLPTLIGLHGGPGVDGTALRYWLAPLADAAQVVVPDLRGHGRSDRGDPASWNLAQWAEDVHQLCHVLGIERPVLLGTSFGGFVAQHYAATYPDDLAGLVLVSTAPRYPGHKAVLARAREVGGERAAAALRHLIHDPGSQLSATDQQHLRALYQRHTDPQGEALEKAMIRTPEVAQAWVPSARQEMDLRDILQFVRCPALALVGELDPFNPPAHAAESVDAIPDDQAGLCVVPNAAHRVFTDSPKFTRERIREFMTGVT